MKLIDMLNASWPPYGIAFTGIAIGVHLKDGNGWLVAIYVLLCLLCIGVTKTRILENEDSEK
jgi:hypothetical protein